MQGFFNVCAENVWRALKISLPHVYVDRAVLPLSVYAASQLCFPDELHNLFLQRHFKDALSSHFPGLFLDMTEAKSPELTDITIFSYKQMGSARTAHLMPLVSCATKSPSHDFWGAERMCATSCSLQLGILLYTNKAQCNKPRPSLWSGSYMLPYIYVRGPEQGGQWINRDFFYI